MKKINKFLSVFLELIMTISIIPISTITAADVNGDGKTNTLDRVILTRYVAKWEGYETLPYKS